MKQIIIFLLVVIIGIMGYNLYTKHQRFSLSEYQYQIPEDIDVSMANKEVLLNYYRAIETVNGHIIMQWSANSIDVRNPSKDDAVTTAAVTAYRNKLANVAFFEAQLRNPEAKKVKPDAPSEEEVKNQLLLKAFYSNPSANKLRLGEQSALVFEIQRILIEKGDSIKHDGLFRTETFNALQGFEAKNGLFPDGRLDAITLEYLLK